MFDLLATTSQDRVAVLYRDANSPGVHPEDVMSLASEAQSVLAAAATRFPADARLTAAAAEYHRKFADKEEHFRLAAHRAQVQKDLVRCGCCFRVVQQAP